MISRFVSVVFGPHDVGERLDRALAQHLVGEGLSRSQLASLCERGLVRCEGVPLRPSAKVRAGGAAVVVEVPPPEPVRAEAEDIPLRVVFEDRALLVVDKPAGLVVHPAKGHATGTLVNAVLHHAEMDDDDDPLRPGIVHRIDRDTSGLLVIAKTAEAREALAARFKAHDIARQYVALCEGAVPPSVTFDTLYGRHPTDRKRFTGRVREGKRACTHVRGEATFLNGAASLVRCTLETGRTHQIRVHLSEAGFPLLGDAAYGRRPRVEALRPIAAALGRQALHAEVLGFEHPLTGEALRFVSPLPPELAAALAALEALGQP